jgi:hypothetical protein
VGRGWVQGEGVVQPTFPCIRILTARVGCSEVLARVEEAMVAGEGGWRLLHRLRSTTLERYLEARLM